MQLTGLIASAAGNVADRPFGRGMRGDGFPWMGVVGMVVLAGIVVLAVLALRRGGVGGVGGSIDRRRQEFEDWHRAAHAGPVPTYSSPGAPAAYVTAPPVVATQVVPVAPPAAPSADAPAPDQPGTTTD